MTRAEHIAQRDRVRASLLTHSEPVEIGGLIAETCGYRCADCNVQIISSIPVERCEPCHTATELS